MSGEVRYAQDVRLEGQWHAALVRSPVPHGRVRAIDVSKLTRDTGLTALDYGFVNTSGAFLGAIILGEPITGIQLAGTALVAAAALWVSCRRCPAAAASAPAA